jgi:hypothetical protein
MSLAGDQGATRWHTVPVQATWIDQQDLLGTVNPHARLFEPSTSGIFSFLAACAEEYRLHEGDSGVHVLCLSGLDRASPDAYLSAILHALDQPMNGRLLRCFDGHAVHPDSGLARWSAIALPPSLRIVGTLSGDESARQLPPDLRDRATELALGQRVSAEQGPGAGAPLLEMPAPSGAPVTNRTLSRWVRTAPLPAPWAELFDRVRSALRARSLDISPRALRSAYTFVASAAPVMPVTEAVDLQLMQRLLPRVSAAALHDEVILDQIAASLGAHAEALPASVRAIEQLRESLG